MIEWTDYDPEAVLAPGWYALIYCWDPSEGAQVGCAYWDGANWSDRYPIDKVSSQTFVTDDDAWKWAIDHDSTAHSLST